MQILVETQKYLTCLGVLSKIYETDELLLYPNNKKMLSAPHGKHLEDRLCALGPWGEGKVLLAWGDEPPFAVRREGGQASPTPGSRNEAALMRSTGKALSEFSRGCQAEASLSVTAVSAVSAALGEQPLARQHPRWHVAPR